MDLIHDEFCFELQMKEASTYGFLSVVMVNEC